MTDPTLTGQPSPEEMRAYLEQLRDADAVAVVAEAYNMLAAAAQVKLGRLDARILIDAMAGMAEAAGPRLPEELAAQMRQGVAQLQMAQVQAEREEAGAGGAPPADQAETSRAGEATIAAPEPSSPPSQEDAASQRMTDRLWIPGRDPGRPPG
ncbi:MAG: hypothetical protein M3415_08710 [Actinomycetota bacterium]|jgi:hypothetical protein|nr:hypothetical protein [Actinomycetota bacterium]